MYHFKYIYWQGLNPQTCSKIVLYHNIYSYLSRFIKWRFYYHQRIKGKSKISLNPDKSGLRLSAKR